MPVDRDLRAVFVSMLVCVAVVASVRLTPVRAVFAVPLCLVLPGYALTAATFPRGLGGMRSLMLTLALSLATLALGALLLDAIPGGLRLASWTILLALVVVAGVGVAGWRRTRTERQLVPPRRLRLRASDALLILIAALIVSGAMVVSRIPLSARNAIGYTQLWMLPTGTAQSPAVRIGVQSAEQNTMTYTLQLTTGAGRPLLTDTSVTLRPGASRLLDISLVPAKLRVRTLVTADLYKGGGAEPYRQVTALITPAATQAGGRGAAHRHAKARNSATRRASKHKPAKRRRS